jgi:hypothetical protein
MGRLFDRRATLNVHGKVLEGIDFDFRVDRSLTATQNTCEVTIYNLNQNTRKFLQQQKGGVVIELHAGYADDAKLPLLYLGQLREVRTVRNGGDWQTEITTGDSDEIKKRPVGFSLGPGTQFETAVKKIVADMGGQAGNLASAIKGGKFADASKEFAEGVTAFGNGDDELRKLLHGAGFEHSWQNGVLQVLPRGGALGASAVTLSEATGLVGSPEIGDGGSVRARSMLNAAIFPGRIVHLVAANLDAFVRCERVVYSGSTSGNDWYADLDTKPPKTTTKKQF